MHINCLIIYSLRLKWLRQTDTGMILQWFCFYLLITNPKLNELNIKSDLITTNASVVCTKTRFFHFPFDCLQGCAPNFARFEFNVP